MNPTTGQPCQCPRSRPSPSGPEAESILATIPDNALHPEDEAALREPASPGRGELRQQLSNAVVALFKQYFGRGPSDCRTYLEPDLVIVVMLGGYTAAERTLFEAGKWHDVRQARLAWQDSMEVRFIDTIERLTHRTVTAFLSANRQDPDLSVELFVLDRGPSGG
ncbi:MAG TPA: DUF2294 domain-containing protein [Solirubrobacterales bacterium]|nr:DUF2294 domain-containing protein [Solirubrobacterales bacterium]